MGMDSAARSSTRTWILTRALVVDYGPGGAMRAAGLVVTVGEDGRAYEFSLHPGYADDGGRKWWSGGDPVGGARPVCPNRYLRRRPSYPWGEPSSSKLKAKSDR
jgi:hypothetical protein